MRNCDLPKSGSFGLTWAFKQQSGKFAHRPLTLQAKTSALERPEARYFHVGRRTFRDPSGSQKFIVCWASVSIPLWGWRMSLDIKQLIAEREVERYELHANHLNEQMVHVLKTIGFDKRYQRGVGQYLYDEKGERYLDLLSGWGVFAVGRNHPTVREALSAVLDSELPNLVQMGVSVLSGVLAERLLKFVPHLDKVFFCNERRSEFPRRLRPASA
jgi:hypothetical protein